MKKLSLIICALTAFFFVSCQQGNPKDKNGDTPKDVVEKMYQSVKAKDFDVAVSYNKIPDTIKMKLMDEKNVYQEFQNNAKDKDGNVIILGEEWKTFVIEQMKGQSSSSKYSLDNWEIVSEEISKTDPNSAKVKTKIQIITQNGKSEAECSFPLKRENGVWLIIG